MSLNMREQQALDGIERRLAGADPKLAALLVTFARLTSGEAMPAREEVPAQGRWTRPAFRRAGRLLTAYAGLGRVMALLWVLIAVGLIAIAVALSSSGGTCVRASALVCTTPAPAHPYHLAVVPSPS